MVRASVLASRVSWVRIPPEQRFFSSEKKELFGLVAFPFFLFIEKRFHACTHARTHARTHTHTQTWGVFRMYKKMKKTFKMNKEVGMLLPKKS